MFFQMIKIFILESLKAQKTIEVFNKKIESKFYIKFF